MLHQYSKWIIELHIRTKNIRARKHARREYKRKSLDRIPTSWIIEEKHDKLDIKIWLAYQKMQLKKWMKRQATDGEKYL